MRRRFLARLFLVTMLLLLAWNLHAAWRNQRDFLPRDVPARRARNITTLLSQNVHPTVSKTFALYQQLRVLRGKTLVVHPRWAAHGFAFRRVSRLRVEVASQPLTLPPQRADFLYFERADFRWHLDEATPLGLLLGDDPAGTERYVLVARETRGLALVMPEALYQRELAGEAVQQ